MSIKLYICDIDNTLLFTDSLNSESYVKSAEQLHIRLPKQIHNEPRITEQIIRKYLPDIEESTIKKLKCCKLKYFLNNLNKITINDNLLDLIKNQPGFLCLWTSSTEKRAIIECNTLKVPYDDLISVNKDLITDDRVKGIICAWAKKYKVPQKDILIVDDNETFLNRIRELGYKTLAIRRDVSSKQY